MLDPSGINVIDVLYRVSTRAQEKEGDSLFNQRRSVEEQWAEPNGISVRRRIEIAESGKGALRLAGAGFAFNRRAEYTELIVEYQSMTTSQRPDAIVIDWHDRWSRNVLEYAALTTAFRMLGIRLLSVGDGLDLTDPRNDLVTNVKAAIGQEQLRITKQKVSEARRSRRERGKWQGGAWPDGYRTHKPDCDGPVEMPRESAGGLKYLDKVRACQCDRTTLHRDPSRESMMIFIWKLLESSPSSWQAMTEEVNARGFTRPNGKPFRWNDLYRIGENPHYAGGMTFDRWNRDKHDGNIKSRKQLSDQQIDWSTDSIPDPYVTREAFEGIYKRRFNKQTRWLRRAPRGSVSELTGILHCPECSRAMSSFYTMSSMKTRQGNPRIAPRKTYVYMQCGFAQGEQPVCGNKGRVRIEQMSANLIEQISKTSSMSDAAITAALKLKTSQSSMRALEVERSQLAKSVEAAENAPHFLTKLLASGSLTQAEVEADLFEHRRDKAAAVARLREIDLQMTRDHAKPDFEKARATIAWLSDRWKDLTVAERAEALRLLVDRVTYVPNSTPYPQHIQVLEYGRAFVQPAAALATTARRVKRA